MEVRKVMVPVADGVRLGVRHWPGTAQTPFLLVHGLSSNALLWDGTARQLAAKGHPVYAVDLRSHGESDSPPDGYDTATAASDLAALVGALELAPAVVAGQSWGGNVVVRFAAEHPERVGALALVDGGWLDLASQFDSWEDCARQLRPPDVDGFTEADAIGYIRKEHPDWADWAVAATVGNFRVHPDGRLERRLPIPNHMRILQSMYAQPPADHLAKVQAPALLLPALPREDGPASWRGDMVEEAAAMLVDATVKPYVGADHDLHAQHPDELAADLLALAERVTR